MACDRLWRTLAVVILGACSREPPAQTDDGVRAGLADSVRFENELIGVGYLRRVAVDTGAGADTIDGILTNQQPVVVGDSVVYGIVYDEQAVTAGFAYDVKARTTRRLTLPDQLFPYGEPRLSRDGRHLAYVAIDRSGRGYGAIAAWPSARVVYRGPAVRMLETDAGVDAVTWHDANRFEIRVDMSHAVGGGTQRIRGTVTAFDSTLVDTIGR
jgi:hypothetical protein